MSDMNALESELKQLPEPTLPDGLAEATAARIARVAELRASAAAVRTSAAESGAGIGAPRRFAAGATGPDRVAGAAALVGLTVGVGAETYRLLVGEAALDLISPRIAGLHGPVEMLSAGPATAVLAAGLLLYVAGFFPPLAGWRREGPSRPGG